MPEILRKDKGSRNESLLRAREEEFKWGQPHKGPNHKSLR